MYFHWLRSWQDLFDHWRGALHSERSVHFFVRGLQNAQMLDYFGFVSDFCWRRADPSQLPPGLCFCDLDARPASCVHPVYGSYVL